MKLVYKTDKSDSEQSLFNKLSQEKELGIVKQSKEGQIEYYINDKKH